MSATETGRFALFSEKEKALIAIALTFFLMDRTIGLSGSPSEPDELAEILETSAALVNEIGAEFDAGPVNPALLQEAIARLRSQGAPEMCPHGLYRWMCKTCDREAAG